MDDELTKGALHRARARVGTTLRGKWRLSLDPTFRFDDIGFRCARSP
jgi:hypothetical protein